MRRVLKPAGELLFCEHGLAPDPAVRRWQDRLAPLWQRLAGGCRLTRDAPALIEATGFRMQRVERFHLSGAPRFVGYHSIGAAHAG